MTKKGKVVDMFSRRDMEEEQQDTKANDSLVDEKGRYVGNIVQEEADRLRSELQALQARQQQIDEMARAWAVEYGNHMGEVFEMLRYLGVQTEEYDPDTQGVFIGEDGHVWIVDMGSDNPKH